VGEEPGGDCEVWVEVDAGRECEIGVADKQGRLGVSDCLPFLPENAGIK